MSLLNKDIGFTALFFVFILMGILLYFFVRDSLVSGNTIQQIINSVNNIMYRSKLMINKP